MSVSYKCPHCKAESLVTRNEVSAGVVTCPKCSSVSEFKPLPIPASRDPITSAIMDASTVVPRASTVFGVVLLVAAAIALGNADRGYSPKYEYGNRFHNDNATGATANAVEFIAQRRTVISAGDFLVAAMISFLIGRVGKLSDRLAK